MNYDLAMMALEGLTRAPMTIRVESGGVVIEGPGASFKELARLCLLMGSAGSSAEDGIELQAGTHLTRQSPNVRLNLTQDS
ncbi:MAG TPA: hypothetical protein VGK31_02175 [Thermoanaerobaculia bacterium]|jgi:hypothetical protein